MQKISVVTINYNRREGLERTIASVLSQDYPALEYIVIDGGSGDGSADLIRTHASKMAYSVSEPDRGRYDAMNKGARAATGDWVLFMNAGDVFHDSSVVSDIFDVDRSDADLIFGHSVRRYPKECTERFSAAGNTNGLPLRMEFSHQSLFARRTLLLVNPFSLDLKIIADAEFVIRMWIQRVRFVKADRVVAVFEMEGISDMERRHSLAEHWTVLSRLGLLTLSVRARFAMMAVRSLTSSLLRQLLPAWLTRRLLGPWR